MSGQQRAGGEGPRPLDDGEVLYLAPTREHYRRVMLLLVLTIWLSAMTAVLMIVVLVLMAVKLSTGIALALGAVIVPLLLLLGAGLVMNMVLLPRTVFAVTAKGLTLTPPYRFPRFVPWEEVRAIEASPAGLMRGAVVAVLADGTRLMASGTMSGFGPSPYPPAPAHLGPDDGSPAPLRVARDAHARYLRGELGPVPGRGR